MKKLLVFTDLDGSLLDHNNYNFDAANDALNLLQKNKFPLIINSSKTFSEIITIRKKLINNEAFICENGGVVYFNNLQENKKTSLKTHIIGKSHLEITNVIKQLMTAHNYNLQMFSSLSLNELISMTNLPKASAIAAQQREASEPFIWNDTKNRLHAFEWALEQQNLQVTQGGRFYHCTNPVNKATGMNQIIEVYKNNEPLTEWIIVALGDGKNDYEMLEKADHAIVINNPQSDQDKLKEFTKTERIGPAGWNEAILALYKKHFKDNNNG